MRFLSKAFAKLGLGMILSSAPLLANAQLSGLFDFHFKDGAQGTNMDATYNHDGSATFSLGTMTLFIEGDIAENVFYSGEVQADLYNNQQQEQKFELHSGSVTFANMWKWKVSTQVGKFDSIVGEFVKRRLSMDNPLFDAPLAYSHKLNIDPDGGFVTANLRVGNGTGIRQISMIDRNMTQTGVRAFGCMFGTKLNYSLGVSNNPVSNPRDVNTNNGLTPSVRLDWIADRQTNFGLTATIGGWMNSLDNLTTNPARYGGLAGINKLNTSSYQNSLVTLYLNHKMGRMNFHSEYLSSTYEVPNLIDDLTANSFYLEGKYSFTKYFYGALRYDTLSFNNDKYLTAADAGLTAVKWDDDVSRIEVGFGNFINKNTLAKIGYQINDYDLPGTLKDFNMVTGTLSVVF